MSISLITEGLLGGGTPDASPPTVSAVSPTPNTAPGSVGGMPLNFAFARSTPIIVDVTDPDGATTIIHVGIAALFLDGTAETVYDAGAFLGSYVAGSSQRTITNGLELTILRAAGWPAAPGSNTPLAVGLRITATDAGGNVATTTLYYQMPLATSLVPAAQVAPISAAVDLAAEIRSFVVWQLRS